jgi:EAL domain-containing protein (putative c-di-GMP-specific phosphodiesterase class I)
VDFESLLRSADLALYAAKEAGRNALKFYRATMSAALHARTELENDLRAAVATQAFDVYFQPLVRASDQRIVGAEALVRWRHPQRGLVLPAEFISVCERLGLIRELGRLVFRAAARQRAEWSAAGFDLLVAVNMSPREFSEPDVVEDLAAALADSGCDPAGLQIEITESMLLGSDERPLATLRAISALGLSIALDDFGTGYSNLAYLRRYPIQALKIDRSFIQGLADNGALTELIVQLCRLMDLKAVAEGVETPEQLAWIVEHGIEHYQGFLFAPPLSAADFSARLLQQAEPATA